MSALPRPPRPRTASASTPGSSADSGSQAAAVSAPHSRASLSRAPPAAPGGSNGAPPPLPPKPAFARAAAVSKPPPLPPKPASARAPRVGDLPGRPSRPSPAPPGAPSGGPTPPPLPTTAKPQRHRRFPSESTQDVTGTLPTSSSSSAPFGNADASGGAEGNGEHALHQPAIPRPFPSPACVLREAGMSQLFVRGRAESKDLSTLQAKQSASPRNGNRPFALNRSASAIVPLSTAFDVEFGAAGIARQRTRDAGFSKVEALYVDGSLPCAALCGGYPGSQPGGEMWSVVEQVVNAPDVSARSWFLALEVLIGIVINATVDNFDTGRGLCTEVVRRMQERPPPVAAGIFTFLTNLGAQAVFAGQQWRDVECMVISIFNDVVEAADRKCPVWSSIWGCDASAAMDSGSDGAYCVRDDSGGVVNAGGCRAHALFWERALKCAIALLGSRSLCGNIAIAVTPGKQLPPDSPRRILVPWIPGRGLDASGAVVSLHALVALARHMPPSTHPAVERLIVGDGVWRGFRGAFEEDDDMIRPTIDEDRTYSAVGGVHTVIGLFVQCRSITTRRRMFALIAEVAVARALERAQTLRARELPATEDDANSLFSILRAYDAGDALATAFRLGPGPSFVMDILRHILFEPLSAKTSAPVPLLTAGAGGSGFADNFPGEGRRPTNFMLGQGPVVGSILSADNKELHARKELRLATIAANKVLHKRFVLNVLIELESMARSYSSSRASHRASGGLHIAEVVEMTIAGLRREGRANSLRSVRHVWHTLHDALMDRLSDDQLCCGDAITVIEQVLSVALLPFPFSNIASEGYDSEGEALLGGERRLIGCTSSIEAADLISGLLRASTPLIGARYVSELRQSLIEILSTSGSSSARLPLFVDDADPMVAYRAIVNGGHSQVL